MAAIAPITVPDGKSTPDQHTYNPISTMPPLWKRNGVTVAAVGMESIKVTSKLASQANGVNKIDIELVVPVMEQPAGGASSGYTAAPAVAHELRAKVTIFAHQRSLPAERKDLRALLIGLLANAQIVSAIDSLEQPY